MGQPLAFISYRRSDSSLASQALHIQLRERFGPSRVFMDVGAIAVGDQWADRLRRAINKATVVLAVVGTGWLKAADAFGRRRLDQPNDWVRLEILTALAARTPILPLLIGGGSEMLPAEGLPPELQPLLNVQMLRLREERWDDDVDLVVAALVKDYGFIASDRRVILPQPEIQIPALAEAQLSDALQTLPGWEPVETLVAGDYPNARQELRKAYRFPSFTAAIEFMRAAVDPIQKLQHHPRWENQWRTVTVFLSTWDVGNRITQLDVNLAHQLDAVYQAGKAARREASPAPSTGT